MTKTNGRKGGGLLGDVAAAAGHTLAALRRWGPGVAGPVLIAYGLWLAWEPLGLIAAGAFLVLLDRRTP
ncbi:hypothetical protein ACWDA3_26035 [Nonomuraea rubra]